MEQMEERSCKKGQVIFKQGDWEMCLYEVVSGAVGIYAGFGTPDEKRLTVLGPQAYFGEMGLAEGLTRSATAVAEEDTAVRVISAEKLGGLFAEDPDKILDIMRHLSARTRELTGEYNEVCRTIAEVCKTESGGRSAGLLEKIKRFAGVWRRQVVLM